MAAPCPQTGAGTPLQAPLQASTPVSSTSGRKRVRESPLGLLLEQLKRLRSPSLDAIVANELLAPFVREALKHDDSKGTLREIVVSFGWCDTTSLYVVDKVDLFCLSTTLQKYRYERLQTLGCGSYAVVYKARNRETNEVIALKKLRFGFDEQGLPSSTLREISLLKELKHENIVELKDIIYGFGSSVVYVVLECLECDLRELLDRCLAAGADHALDAKNAKVYMHQILSAVHHAHSHCVLHRDLKPQNILVNAARTSLKVADFGLARTFLPCAGGGGGGGRAYTDKVVTLWYRAPELLMGARSYGPAVDLWSVGCIMAELLNGEPLFRAESEIGLLLKIFQVLGTPNEGMWQGVGQLANFSSSFPQWRPQPIAALAPRLAGDAAGQDLLRRLLAYDPEQRISAAQALAHPWFDELRGGGGGGDTGTAGLAAAGPQARQPLQPQQQQQSQGPAAAAAARSTNKPPALSTGAGNWPLAMGQGGGRPPLPPCAAPPRA